MLQNSLGFVGLTVQFSLESHYILNVVTKLHPHCSFYDVYDYIRVGQVGWDRRVGPDCAQTAQVNGTGRVVRMGRDGMGWHNPRMGRDGMGQHNPRMGRDGTD